MFNKILSILVIFLFATNAVHAISLGQFDDFEDGSVQGWTEGAFSPNDPTNESTGGPDGVGDNYLQNVSTGGSGSGSKQVMFNQVQWTGDYLSAGVNTITVDLANFGVTELDIRIAIQGPANSRYGSTSSFALPADGVWRSATFSLDAASLSFISGTDGLSDVLSSVNTFRILSANAGPSYNGDSVAATLGIDNVTASVVVIPPPTPAAAPLLGLSGLLTLLFGFCAAGLVALRKLV